MSGMTNLKFLEALDDVAQADVQGLRKAAEAYGDSWKKRGGVGAFMMLARKWDRLENYLGTVMTFVPAAGGRIPVPEAMTYLSNKIAKLMAEHVGQRTPGDPDFGEQDIMEVLNILQDAKRTQYDIFAALESDRRSEGVIDDIRDLRRYLMLVEAEMVTRGVVDPGNHRDNVIQSCQAGEEPGPGYVNQDQQPDTPCCGENRK